MDSNLGTLPKSLTTLGRIFIILYVVIIYNCISNSFIPCLVFKDVRNRKHNVELFKIFIISMSSLFQSYTFFIKSKMLTFAISN